jgi:hypothetical protein
MIRSVNDITRTATRIRRKDERSDIIVIQVLVLELLPSEQPIRKPPSRSDRNRRQQLLPSNIPDRENAFDVRLLPLVKRHVPVLDGLDADVLESEVLGAGMSADGPEEAIDDEGGAVVDGEGEGGVGVLDDLGDVGLLVDVDAGTLWK